MCLFDATDHLEKRSLAVLVWCKRATGCKFALLKCWLINDWLIRAFFFTLIGGINEVIGARNRLSLWQKSNGWPSSRVKTKNDTYDTNHTRVLRVGDQLKLRFTWPSGTSTSTNSYSYPNGSELRRDFLALLILQCYTHGTIVRTGKLSQKKRILLVLFLLLILWREENNHSYY